MGTRFMGYKGLIIVRTDFLESSCAREYFCNIILYIFVTVIFAKAFYGRVYFTVVFLLSSSLKVNSTAALRTSLPSCEIPLCFGHNRLPLLLKGLERSCGRVADSSSIPEMVMMRHHSAGIINGYLAPRVPLWFESVYPCGSGNQTTRWIILLYINCIPACFTNQVA